MTFLEEHPMTRAKCEDLRLCPGLGFSQICGGKYQIRILWILAKRSYRYGDYSRPICIGKGSC